MYTIFCSQIFLNEKKKNISFVTLGILIFAVLFLVFPSKKNENLVQEESLIETTF